MKIYLHVGPHKTGTTSVQQWMLDNARKHMKLYGLYYPEPPEEGPGHALLAWDSLGMHGRKVEPGFCLKRWLKMGCEEVQKKYS